MASKNTMSESSIERYFVRSCKSAGMKALKMVPTYEAGIPDRQVLYRGVTAFVELKKYGRVPDPHQLAYIRSLMQAGFYVDVVDSTEKAMEFIEGFKKHVDELHEQLKELKISITLKKTK